MLKFSANLTMMFTEVDDPIARISAAAAAGFGAIEYIFIYDMDAGEIRRAMDADGLDMSVINIAVGEGVKMGPLVAAAPGMEAAFRENLDASKRYCDALRPTGLVVPAYAPPDGVAKSDALRVFKENMKITADELAEFGVPVLIEALNPEIRPNSLLATTADVMEVIEDVGHPNLGIEYDAYHCFVTDGCASAEEMAAIVEKHLDLIGNIQIADVPGRGEPGTGEIDHDVFFAALERMGYDKWVACEYVPTSTTLETLGWRDKWVA
ncbi:MAG: TIM barrel protein [Rhodospirillales bacterium]|nr:TIM barrel protein [Rhodospirillales bacterium]